MNFSLKGQAAIEYMTVFGIALVLAAPFVIKAQSSIIDLKSGSGEIVVQDALNDIEVATETVSASGEPATRTFAVRLPESLNSTDVRLNSTIITVNTPSGTSTFSRTFDFNVSGELPSTPGSYLVKTEAVERGVKIEVVS